MRKIKAITASALVASLMLSVTACGGSADATTTTAATEATTTTTMFATTTLATDTAVQEKVNDLAEAVKDETLTVDKKIKWLAWWDMDETSATSELFKTTYGIPEAGSADYGDDADHIFENISVAYAERYTELAKLVQSGDSPDMFPFEVTNFPYSIYQGLFQPIDGIIDIDAEEWSATREVMKQFEWGGKNYCAIPAVNMNTFLWYRRSVMAENGLDDPYELYKAGNWNWDTFMDMCAKFSDPDSGKYCIDGWYVQSELIGTSGSPMIGLDGGKLISHFYDANLERVMDMISKLCTENYRYPRHELNGWNVNYTAWANGDTLFFDDGTWRFTEHWVRFRDRYSWGDDEIFFVPFPKDPNSDEYYHLMKQDALMLVSGAPNVDGFKAWNKCVIACTNDQSVTEAQREKDKNDYGWTDEQLDFLYELTHGAVSPIFDLRNGIGEDVASSGNMENPVECIVSGVYITGDSSYTALRSENEGIINQRIEELNATIS